MKTKTIAKLRDAKSGRTYEVTFISLDVLKRIHLGELAIVGFEDIIESDIRLLSPVEVDLLMAEHRGETIPPTLQKHLDAAKEKRDDIRAYHERLERLETPP